LCHGVRLRLGRTATRTPEGGQPNEVSGLLREGRADKNEVLASALR